MTPAVLASPARPPTPPFAEAEDPREALVRMAAGRWASQALHAAAVLGLADHLAAGPRTPGDLAAATGTHEPNLRRLVRALASEGVFAESLDGRIALTPRGGLLRAGTPGSLRALVLHLGSPPGLDEGERRPGAPRPELDPHRAEDSAGHAPSSAGDPGDGALPEGAAAAHAEATAEGLLAAFDFTGVRRVVDAGSGGGALLARILRAHPAMAGAVADAQQPGAGIPAGADLYVLGFALHGGSDARAAALLGGVRAAMAPSSRLLVVDYVVPPGPARHVSKWLDLQLLAAGGGRARSLAEHRALLEGAGLGLVRVHHLPTGASLLEAEPLHRAGP